MSKVTALTSKEIRETAIDTLSEVIALKADRDVYNKEDMLNILVAAAADRTTIEQACVDLDKGCHSNTVRNQVKDQAIFCMTMALVETCLLMIMYIVRS